MAPFGKQCCGPNVIHVPHAHQTTCTSNFRDHLTESNGKEQCAAAAKPAHRTAKLHHLSRENLPPEIARLHEEMSNTVITQPGVRQPLQEQPDVDNTIADARAVIDAVRCLHFTDDGVSKQRAGPKCLGGTVSRSDSKFAIQSLTLPGTLVVCIQNPFSTSLCGHFCRGACIFKS